MLRQRPGWRKADSNAVGIADGSAIGRYVNYCSDWSVTGPLMVEYGVEIGPYSKDTWMAANIEFIEDTMSYRHVSENKNPLRSVCEVILMIGDKL